MGPENETSLFEQCARIAEEFCEQGRDGYQIAKAIRAIERTVIRAQCAPDRCDFIKVLQGWAFWEDWAETPFLREDLLNGLCALTSPECPDPMRLPPTGCLCRNDFERSHCAYEKRGECTRVASSSPKCGDGA